MRRILLLAGVLGGVVPAAAQPPVTTFHDSLLVTAALAAAERDDSPASATVIGAEEIAARQASTVAELLATVPGLTVLQSGSPGHAVSLFTRGSESNHTLVLWNGVPLNDPFLGGFDWAFLPTEGVERVEVVRGPFSALYGSNALGGVVQVLTRRDRDGGDLRLEAGEHEHRRGAFAAGASPAGGKVSGQLAASRRRGEGGADNDFFDGSDLTARGEWLPAAATGGGLLLRWHDSEIGIPRTGARSTPRRRQTQEESSLALPLRFARGDWSGEALLSTTRSDLAFRDPDDALSSLDTETAAARARLEVVRALGERGWLAGGGEWEQQEVDNGTNFGVNLSDRRRRTRALFAQFHGALQRTTAEVGVRWDDGQEYGDEVSPRLGLVWSPAAGQRLRASWGQAFRAPSFLDLYFPFSGNPALRPESSTSAELGWEVERGAWTATLAAFDNRVEDLIDFDFAAFRSENLRRARSRGVEAGALFRRAQVTARAHATWLEAEDEASGRALLRRPRRSASLHLTWTPGTALLSAVGRYVGERADLDAVTFARTTNPAFTRLDLAAEWRFGPAVAPFVRVENAADARYEEVLGFPALGRTLSAGVNLRF